MIDPKIEEYDGPREGFDYVRYDNSFPRQQAKQILQQNGRIRDKAFALFNTVMFGLPSWVVWKIEVDDYCSKLYAHLDRGGSHEDMPEVIDDLLVKGDLVPIQTEQKDDNGFTINGVNSTKTIRNLEYLTGLPIYELERRMLPDNRPFSVISGDEYFGSNGEGSGGFIKPGESLIEILASDNDYILGRGLTHQDIAGPMLRVFNMLSLSRKHHHKKLRIELDDETYIVSRPGFPMTQDSPFNDGITAPGFNIAMTRESTGEEFRYAPLTAMLIHRYGFYEGDVIYRVDPKKAIDFFRPTHPAAPPN